MTQERTEKITTQEGHALFVSRMDGNGLPVVFLNSIGADHHMWDAVRGRMNRPTVAYDARGHGQSDVTEGRLSLKDLAGDARAVMDHAKIDRAVLCGLSLGGLTAMQVAADAPKQLAGLVLANTATSFGPPSLWQDRAVAARAGGWPDLVDPTLARWMTEAWRAAHPGETADVRNMLEAMPPEGYAAACAALEVGDTTEALAEWTGRTLVIAGAHDLSATVARAEEMVAVAKDAELVVLETAHIAAIEDPDGFAAALERFMQTVEGPHD